MFSPVAAAMATRSLLLHLFLTFTTISAALYPVNKIYPEYHIEYHIEDSYPTGVSLN